MVQGFWGKKIGMTQVFLEEKVIPVTAIDISNWYITQLKTKDKEGYDSVQLGCVKEKYADQAFSETWLKDPKKYFRILKEVHLDIADDQAVSEELKIGQSSAVIKLLEKGDFVDAFGITKGSGFQGVVKRHGFAGGRASHGATFGRFTGSLSWMRSQGRIPKGKKMPGHMGVEKRVMKNLEVVRVEPEGQILLVKGSVPGKSGSFIYLRKCR